MRYYKVFRQQGGRLWSSWTRGVARVEYIPGQLSVAPGWLAEYGYNLTVFNSLENTLRYRQLISGSPYSTVFPVYQVAISGTVATPGEYAENTQLNIGRIIKTSAKWPDGTLMVQGIIPMAEVPFNEAKAVWKEWKAKNLARRQK